jgi:chromosome segregation ATPase
MATESAGEAPLSVTLPPSLESWVEERAEALDADREAVLVGLLAADGVAADRDGQLRVADEADAVPPRLASEADLESLADRLKEVEADLETNVEPLRKRVLQLRAGLEARAPQDHTHEEFSRLDDRCDELSSDLEAVATDVEALLDRVDALDSRLDEADGKLARLARAVVTLREQTDSGDEALARVRRAANRRGIADADCDASGGSVSVALLTEAVCPHCGTAFDALEPPAAGLGRALGFRTPKLTREERPALEASDE